MMTLSVDALRAGYAGGDVLQGISLHLAHGEIVGVIGRNGVGKTTMMRSLIGLLPARAGKIVFAGADITALAPEQRARKGIGYVPQGRGMFPAMSVRDNLRCGAFVGGGRNRPRYDDVERYFPFLGERARQLAGTLSGGQQEMLAIARALVGGPDLLLLDEPSEGVQPSIVESIGDILLSLNRARGLGILIVEQNVDLMRAVAQRVYVLEKGRIIAELDKAAIGDGEELAAYLAL